MTTLSPCLDRLAGDLGVARRGAAEVVDRRAPAEELLGGRTPTASSSSMLATRSAFTSGRSSRASSEWAMRLRVVSLPATHERDEEHVELVLA